MKSFFGTVIYPIGDLVAWHSHKQSDVAVSSTETEDHDVSETCKDMLLYLGVWHVLMSISICTDRQAAMVTT